MGAIENGSARLGVLPIQIFRVDPGAAHFLRMLSEDYRGLFTHYKPGKGSVICLGDKTCETTLHKLDRLWKGYACAEVWGEKTQKWWPTVLEISESLELDFRGLFKRGQMWEIWRDHPIKRKPSKITGKLHEQLDPASLSPAFDLFPILRGLYHVNQVVLDARNPLPDRVMGEARDGPPPAILAPRPVDQAVPIKSFAEMQAELNAKKRSPAERKQQSAG